MMIPEYRGENFGREAIRLDPKRLKQGMNMLYQAIRIDVLEEARKPSGLPFDWRNIRFKSAYSFQ